MEKSQKYLAIALCLWFTTAMPGVASAETVNVGEVSAEGSIKFYSVVSGEWYSGQPIIDRASTTPKSTMGIIQPKMNPISMLACNLGWSDWGVQSFTTTTYGTVNLLCGTSTSGYIHIRAKHESHWVSQMGGPGSWDDYMVWSSAHALRYPKESNFQSGQKRCYTTPIKVYRVQSGATTYWKTFNPTVVISTNNKIVITSIPTTNSTC